MSTSVPVIDVNELHDAGTLGAIDRACREWGFFQVTGHGIPAGVTDELLAAARAFFSQPMAHKQRILRSADNPWGYYDRELTKNVRDRKEVFDFGPGDGAAMVPQWPQSPPGFESCIRRYYARCEVLALRLLSAVSINLGMPSDYLSPGFCTAATSFLRLNYYPRQAASRAPRAFGVGQHTDAGALTLLMQDRQAGLEVCRDGTWHLVEPRDDALVVNIGDIVQVWSNDRYRAALHRVTSGTRADRYSVPFFCNPSYDTDYEPLPTMIDAAHPPRYRAINWREFRTRRAAGDYADYGNEVQITDYRL